MKERIGDNYINRNGDKDGNNVSQMTLAEASEKYMKGYITSDDFHLVREREIFDYGRIMRHLGRMQNKPIRQVRKCILRVANIVAPQPRQSESR